MTSRDSSRPDVHPGAREPDLPSSDLDRAGFFDASPNAYLVLDRRLHIAAANRAYLDATGRELDDIVGRWAWEAFPTDPETERQAIALFERVIATKRPDTMALLRFDIPRPEADGGFERRFWSLIHAPVLGDDGEVAFVVQHALDVTELERLREEVRGDGERSPRLEPAHAGIFDRADSVHRANLVLRSESERLRALFRKAPGFICVLSGPDHVFELANEAFLRLVGDRHLIGLPLREAMPDLTGQGYFELLDRVYATGERHVAHRTPIRLQHLPDTAPEERFLDFIYEPVRDGNGAVTGIFVEGHDATEQVRAEASLRDSEARLAGALAIARLGTFEWDLATDAVRLDARSRELFCFGPDEGGHAQDVFDRIHPDDVPRVRAEAAASAQALSRLESEYRIVLPDGTARVIASLSDAVPGPDAKAARMVGVFADVTERRAAEDAAAAERERQRLMLRQMPGFAALLSGPEHRFEYVNDAYIQVAGRRDFVDRSVREAFPDLEGQGFFELLDQVYATGEPFAANDVPVRLAQNGGEVRFIDHRYEPVRDDAGQVTGIFVGGYDVTERVRAQAEMRESEERLRELNETLERRVAERTAELSESQRRFRGIFDSALQFMALLAPDGTVVEVNRTALAWSGIEPSDIVGKPFWLAAPMRGNPALQAAVRSGIRRAAAGETVRAEHEMRGAGEVRATIDFSLKPVPGERGEPVWLVAEGRDVTELKAAQEALRQSQKLESMGQLTGGVAHDINNLLTPIMGSLDLLQRRGLGGEREQRLIAGALQSAERVRVLVQRLLAFARRQPLQPRPVDLGALIAGMADLVASTSGPQTKVMVDVADDLPAAVADPNQIEMAILNLSVNARDAMPDGGRLTIAARAEDVAGKHRSGLAAGRYVRLSVADTGGGMDEATLRRAIEPFFSTKGVGKGTGLGLSMVHGLAAQLGGALGIASKPGLGTTVELWLPTTQEAVEVPARVAERAAQTRAGVALLVDDEEVVRASTADMLAELGYRVVEAASAEEALRLVDGGLTPEVVVTDHLMPGLSGTEFAREVRRRLPSARALVISGYAEVEGVAPDLPRLVKPFKQADLVAKLTGPLLDQ